MEDIKIEIKAPLYRGFLLVLISGLFWFTLFSVVLVIMAIVSQSGGLFGMVVGGYMLMLISFIALKIYQKASKCRIVIDGIEVAKYRGSKKVKSIAIEDIEGMNFEKYDFPHASFDAVIQYREA